MTISTIFHRSKIQDLPKHQNILEIDQKTKTMAEGNQEAARRSACVGYLSQTRRRKHAHRWMATRLALWCVKGQIAVTLQKRQNYVKQLPPEKDWAPNSDLAGN